jgi:hypothetical protein
MREPRLFLLRDLHLAEAFNRLAGFEVLQFQQLANLDLGLLALAGGIGEPLGPFERLRSRVDLDQRVPGDEFLRLDKGPIDQRALFS